MFSGSIGASGRLTVQLADQTKLPSSVYVMGIATNTITNGSEGFVTAFGKIRGINATGVPVGETWNDGDILYPHPTIAGGLTKQEPPAGKWKLIVAAVVHNTSNGTIFVRLTPGNNIGELDNIQDINSTSGDLLVKSGSLWKNTRQLTGSYGITGSLSLTGSQDVTGYIGLLPVSSLAIPTNTTASYIYTSGSTNDLYFTQYNGPFTNTTRLRWLEGNIYTGILYGGIVTGSVAGTTFNVSSGSGIIVNLNATKYQEPYPTIQYVSWGNFTNVTPTLLSTYDTTWLTINSSGSLEQSSTAPVNGDFDTKIQIGSLVHPNRTNITFYKTFTVPSYGIAQQTYEFIRSFGGIKVSGHTLSASGSSLSVNRSSGVAFGLGRNYVNDPNKPSLVSDAAYNAPSIFRYYKSGSVFVTTTGTTTLDVGNYNTPNTSTGLSSVHGGSYTIQRAFYFPNQQNQLGVYYGRQTYNSITTALQNYQFEDFEELENTLTQAVFLGYIIVKGNTTDLSNTADAKFLQAGSFRNTTSAGGGGVALQNIDDLADVVITSVGTGDILYYNGSNWVNSKQLSGTYGITGSLQATSFTGSLLGSASYATTSSHALTSSYLTPFKSGELAPGSFNLVGGEYVANVNFGTAYPNVNYSISVIGSDARTFTIENKLVGGFRVNTNSNVILDGNVYWMAIPYNNP